MAAKKNEAKIDRETRRIYWMKLRNYKWLLIAALILRPVFLLSAYVGNVYLASLALDRLTSHTGGSFWQNYGGILIAALILEIIRLISEQLSFAAIFKAQLRVQDDLALHCYENLTYRDANFLSNQFTGSLVNQTNKFIGSFARITEVLYWQLYPLMIFTTATFVILFTRLPAFGFLMLFLTIMYVVFSYRGAKKNSYYSARLSHEESRNTGQLADMLTNAMAVKSYAKERYEIKRYKLGIERIQQAGDELRRFIIKKDSRVNTLVSLMSFLALIISVQAVDSGYASIGTVVLATAMTRDMLQRLRDLNSNMLRNISHAFGDAREMTALLTTETAVQDVRLPASFEVTAGAIEFSDVDFWYPEKSASEPLFNGLNLSVAPGEKVGLVGPSGGGKTTITKLLLRFMDIQHGAIKIDGQDIAKSLQAEVRRAISYVPQDPLLFHRTIAENIAYGDPRASKERIIAAAKKANAHTFISKLVDGYDTLVGERGVKLSGGQRQRIAIARAMLKNSPILVLDEATSALDSEAEALIQEALWNLMKGKTAVVIAHRLSTIQKMDRIIVLDEGKIVEQGTHAQLLKKKTGLYTKLWKHQSGGFLQD